MSADLNFTSVVRRLDCGVERTQTFTCRDDRSESGYLDTCAECECEALRRDLFDAWKALDTVRAVIGS